MSTQVVRVESFSKGSLGNIGNESEREDIEHRNLDIDKSRSNLNHYYKETKNGFYAEWNNIKKELNASGKEVKNVTAFEGMVITSDRAFFENFGWVKGEPVPDKVKEFFNRSYEYAKQEIGFNGSDRNIMSAVVHYDETTPHLQLYYLPITEKWSEKVYAKDETGKVLRNEKGSPIQLRDDKGDIVYKRVENIQDPKLSRTEFWQSRGGRYSYRRMQDRFHEQIGKKYGLERGEINSDREHQTKNEWESQKLVQNKKSLQSDLESLQSRVLTAKEVNELQGKKTPLGGLKNVSYREFESLKITAVKYESACQERDMAIEKAKAAEKKIAEVKKEAEKEVEKALKENPSFKLIRENALLIDENRSLHSRLERIKEWLSELIEFLPTKFREFVRDIIHDREPFEQEKDHDQGMSL